MGKIKGTKIEGKNEERCFDVLLKSRIPDLNSIRTPSGVLEADLLYKYIMDAHVHQCIGASVHRCIGRRKVAERIRPRVKLNLNSS